MAFENGNLDRYMIIAKRKSQEHFSYIKKMKQQEKIEY